MVPHRPYFHSLPSEYRSLVHEDRLGPPQGYTFSNYYRQTTILNKLRQWVDGTLPESFPIRPVNIFHYPPIILLEHYNGHIGFQRPSTDIKPVWFFTHLVKNAFESYSKRFILYGHEDGHWVKQLGRTEIKNKEGTTIGFLEKSIYYESYFSGSCSKTEHRMEEYTLANYPEGTRGRLSETKSGEWMVVRLSVIRQTERYASIVYPPRSRTRLVGRGRAAASKS